MGIENTDVQISNPDSVSRYWKDYEISPMAANVQWIFYHDKARGVWVKILLNEKEAKLPIATSRFPYYPWKTVCAYFKERIEMAKGYLSKTNLNLFLVSYFKRNTYRNSFLHQIS